MKHILPIAIISTIAFLFIYFSNLSGPTAHIMHPVNLADLTPTQQAQHQRAMDAQKEMFQTLLGKLTAAIQEGGPTNAITICSTEAKTIADQISKKYDLEIARTSSKLRNDNNSPHWSAKKALQSSPTPPTTPIILTNQLGALTLINPITIAPPCLQCHGSPNGSNPDISPETLSKLNELYPNDQAIGYNEGDLRGWFTIYLPPNN